MAGNDIHVGLVGAGIGGLAATIALRHAGAKVTVLEATAVLGEVCAFSILSQNWTDRQQIGAGIQMVFHFPTIEFRNLKLRYREDA